VSSWCELLLREKSIIRGKWQGNRYEIVRKLGSGANGNVYLVIAAGGRKQALKISAEWQVLQSEINILQTLHFGEGHQYVLDADEVELAGELCAFYVMRWVDGCDLRTFVRDHGRDWLLPLGTQMLRQLRHLHLQGYAFCDLKAENVLVERHGRVQLIDYGGVTAFGCSLRQYTEQTDRGFWRAGERVAAADYDWFAFAILCIDCIVPKSLQRLATIPHNERSVTVLLKLVEQEAELASLRSFLRHALKGSFGSPDRALDVWHSTRLTKSVSPISRTMSSWLKIIFACSILLFIWTILYVIP
jgi:serine/threonine protein kinase